MVIISYHTGNIKSNIKLLPVLENSITYVGKLYYLKWKTLLPQMENSITSNGKLYYLKWKTLLPQMLKFLVITGFYIDLNQVINQVR